MAKFKVRFKVEKLELEIEGERENLPAITHGLKQHLAGFIQAPAAVIGVEEEPLVIEPAITAGNGGSGDVRKRKRRNRSSVSGNDDSVGAAVDFRHDGAKWGTPKQDWSTAQKAMWLLYAVAKQTEHKELSYGAVVETFNKHFRQAKEVNK